MILVTGASGLSGRELVGLLSSRGVPVRAMVRNPAKAGSLETMPGVEVVVGDLARPETMIAPLRGVDRAMLISSSTPDMLDVQSAFVDAAKASGVRHVVKLSGIIPELDSPFRFARMHGEIELRLERSGVAFTHLRAGEFMQSYFRQAQAIANRGELPLAMSEARIASIDAAEVARVAADVLTTPGHEGKTYPITGPESLTMHEVAERLSTALGKPVRYVAIDPAQAHAARLAAGMPPFLADGLDELFSERRKGKEAQVYTTIQDVFGWRPATFLEFATRHAAVFRGDIPSPR